jgi:Spy/CpxP family protein refolding chaperone
MKRLVHIALIALIAATAAACSRGATSNPAQPADQSGAMGQSGAPGRAHRMGKILQTLGLSDSQKTQVRSIMRKAREKSRGADPETRRANMKAAFAEIDTLLTPSQRTQLHAQMQAMRQQQPDHAPSQ